LKNSKIEHGDVSHDDLLFAYLVIRWIWTYGTNLGHFFIYKNKTLTGSDGQEITHDQEFLDRFLPIANLNKKDRNFGELTSQKIIEEWYENQRRIEEKNREENIADSHTESFQDIFSMNFENGKAEENRR